MYKIYTSYFSNKRLKKDAQFIPICCKILHAGHYAAYYAKLAPAVADVKALYNKEITEEQFTLNYLNRLEGLRLSKSLDLYVEDMLLRLKYSDIVLLCYETPKKFCHRHVLAKFLNKHYSLDIQEY